MTNERDDRGKIGPRSIDRTKLQAPLNDSVETLFEYKGCRRGLENRAFDYMYWPIPSLFRFFFLRLILDSRVMELF